MKKIQEHKSEIILTILLAGYLIFNGILLAGHELWRDEANVWLFARDTTIPQLFREIRYQGHPCLWYLIVMPFAKAGLPFGTLSVLSYLVMAVTAGVFVYRGPFHPLTKAVCLFSPMFSYYYPVVARNYCLVALLLLLLAELHTRRREKSVLYGILLGLLVQADTIALAPAGLISLMWLWESIREAVQEAGEGKEGSPHRTGVLRQTAKGLWIPLASLLLWGAEFWQVSDSPEFQMRLLSLSEMAEEIRHFSIHILDRMTGGGGALAGVLALLFLAAAVLAARAHKSLWPFLVMLGSFFFEVVFSIMVYQLHIWHYIALCFVLLWCFWISIGENKEKVGRYFGEGLLVLLGVFMFLRWNAPEESSSLSNALHGLYSDGVHTAAYIREKIGTEEPIVFTNVTEASTVQAYLGKEYVLYFAGSGEPETYADYTKEQEQEISYEELLLWAGEQFPEKEAFYLLWCPGSSIREIPETEKESWEVCYQTEGKSARGEEYTLYKIPLSE